LTRREVLALGAGGVVCAQAPKADEVIATPTQDTTPRVGIVLSSFAGGSEHDGAKLAGIESPRPVTADLDDAFIDAWVRKTIELGSPRATDLSKIVAPDDWVVIKTDISSYPGGDGYTLGAQTDPRVVRAVIRYLLEHGCGARVTIAEGAEGWQPIERSRQAADGWTTGWGGAYGGLSYKAMIAELANQHRGVRFELADLNFADSIELPVPGGAVARRNAAATYAIAKVIQQCDKLISIAPLKADPRMGVALTFGNYVGIAPGARYGFPKAALKNLGSPAEVMVDLFNYHPADYCVLGGMFGVASDGATIHRNVLVAGTKAVSVDAVAASVMGFKPGQLAHLSLAEKSGAWGVLDTDAIWTRGNEIEEARRAFAR
jgi:uncharacterized protein (DUF362 family)